MFAVSYTQLLIFISICVLLVWQRVAIKKGNLVKVEYSKPKRFIWAFVISALVATNGIVFGNIYFVFFAIAFGIYLYFFKQWYQPKRD